jgi:hypothetical protein
VIVIADNERAQGAKSNLLKACTRRFAQGGSIPASTYLAVTDAQRIQFRRNLARKKYEIEYSYAMTFHPSGKCILRGSGTIAADERHGKVEDLTGKELEEFQLSINTRTTFE